LAGTDGEKDDIGFPLVWFDNVARKLLITQPNTAVASQVFDAVGNVQSITNVEPGGALSVLTYTYYHWDAAGNMSAAEPPAGVVTFVHDAERRRVGKTSIDGSTTRFVYDAKRLLQETAPDGSEEYTDTSGGARSAFRRRSLDPQTQCGKAKRSGRAEPAIDPARKR